VSDIPLSVEDIQDRVRDARATSTPLSPVGGSTQAHIGYPAAPNAVPFPITGLDRIIEYMPDDMVVVAQAGMTLDALQILLGERNQWLPLETAAPARQTLGGIVATRSSSLVRACYGSVRDWLIGVGVVGGDGQIVRGGGKVVKNVSGYDLPKLYCGSFGTLGIVTDVAFKVAPRPEASIVLRATLPNERSSEVAIDSILASTSPAFVYLLGRSASKSTMGRDAADALHLLVRFDGTRESVAELAMRAETSLKSLAITLAEVSEHTVGPFVQALRDFAIVDAPLTVRYSTLSSDVAACVRMVEDMGRKQGLGAEVLAECRVGGVTARFIPEVDSVDWAGFYPEFRDRSLGLGGNYVVERMPDAWRGFNAPVWFPLGQDIELMRGIKRSLDPGNIFNPGRFVGGI